MLISPYQAILKHSLVSFLPMTCLEIQNLIHNSTSESLNPATINEWYMGHNWRVSVWLQSCIAI